MSGEDQRNTLIVELAGRTRGSVASYQALGDGDLAGAGALLVYLRGTRSRTDAQIRTMSADDMRNTVIVEINAQTRRSDLQALTNMQLALLALGSQQHRGLASIPEAQRPGQHTMVLRADHALIRQSVITFAECRGSGGGRATLDGTGAGLRADVGWGNVEYPVESCFAWITQLSLSFDTRPFTAIPVKTLDHVILAYREEEDDSCSGIANPNTGQLWFDHRCWTDGEGNPVMKPNGCLALSLPADDWIRNPPPNDAIVGFAQFGFAFPKVGPSAWDVTAVFRNRHMPGIGDRPDSGLGYMLRGEPINLDQLTGDDDTRCASRITDIRLEVTYTVPPLQDEYDVIVR